jgi:hypothetical protein
MKILIIIVALLCFFGQAIANEPQLPPEWRSPTLKELQAVVEKDLNGDNYPDKAFLVKSTKFIGEAVVVWLSDKKGNYHWVTLLVNRPAADVPYLSRIWWSPPGEQYIACIQSGDKCVPPKSSKEGIIKTEFPVLVYSGYENATGADTHIFFWDKKQQKFIHARQGD